MQKRVLILSGPTHEHIDPVRFIGNASSGKMGKTLAEEAQNLGYEVEFITGPISSENLPLLPADHIHKITGAAEMLIQAEPLFETSDIIIFVAAIADYAPTEIRVEKINKTTDDLVLRLRPTPDLAKTLCAGKRTNQIAIGFALQTSDGEAHARRKLEGKNLNAIILNPPTSIGAPIGTFSFLSNKADHFQEWGSIQKTDCAKKIFEAISSL